MRRLTLDRYLAPAESLGELVFGLVMALSFTLAASTVAQHDPAAGETALLAAVGCNLAWGIIDAAMFVLGRMYQRSLYAAIHQRLVAMSDEAERSHYLAGLLRGHLNLEAEDARDEVDRLARELSRIARRRPIPRNRPTRSDLLGGLVVFALVALSAVWAALPLLVFAEQQSLLRASNLITIGALFFIGYSWARHTNAAPLRVGGLSAGIGVALVLVAVALGG